MSNSALNFLVEISLQKPPGESTTYNFEDSLEDSDKRDILDMNGLLKSK